MSEKDYEVLGLIVPIDHTEKERVSYEDESLPRRRHAPPEEQGNIGKELPDGSRRFGSVERKS
jgi:hypothetical protein